jgi:hypothetical protein
MLWQVSVAVVVAAGIAGGVLGQEQHAHSGADGLGEVSFPVSCLAEVRKPFERGVALLDSFAYTAAEKQFAEVNKADPQCAMAHWGVAMTYYRQLLTGAVRAATLAGEQDKAKRLKTELSGSETDR